MLRQWVQVEIEKKTSAETSTQCYCVQLVCCSSAVGPQEVLGSNISVDSISISLSIISLSTVVACQPLTLNCQSTQVGDLLSKDPCDLNLSLEFWSPVETSSGGGPGRIQRRAPQRQLSLFNFIRLCSDLLPALLFSPFMHMLTGLCNSVKTAHHGFNFLKANSPSLGMLTRTPCM